MATTLEGAILAKLSGTSAVTAIVPAARMYMGLYPENIAFPAIRYQRASTTPRDLTLYADANDKGTVNLAEAVIFVSGMAKSGAEAKSLAKAIREALHGMREIVAGINIQRCMQENEIDLPEEDTGVYHIQQVFRVLYLEP